MLTVFLTSFTVCWYACLKNKGCKIWWKCHLFNKPSCSIIEILRAPRLYITESFFRCLEWKTVYGNNTATKLMILYCYVEIVVYTVVLKFNVVVCGLCAEALKGYLQLYKMLPVWEQLVYVVLFMRFYVCYNGIPKAEVSLNIKRRLCSKGLKCIMDMDQPLICAWPVKNS